MRLVLGERAQTLLLQLQGEMFAEFPGNVQMLLSVSNK